MRTLRSLVCTALFHSRYHSDRAVDKDITTGKQVDFRLIGHAKAVANLSIGTLTLDPIKFNVSSSLNGLQGLDGRTTIDAVDVQGGSSEGILLNINGSFLCFVWLSPTDAFDSHHRQPFQPGFVDWRSPYVITLLL